MQCNRAHIRETGMRKDSPAGRVGHNGQVLDGVVGGDANAIAVIEADHAFVFVCAAERIARRQRNGIWTKDRCLQLQGLRLMMSQRG